MLGLTKPTERINLELEDADPYFGEEGQALVNGSSRRLGISNGDGGGGDRRAHAHVAFDISRWGRIYKWGAVFLALIALVVTYQIGLGEGYTSNSNTISDPVNYDAPSPADTPIPPTYRPTDGQPKLTPQPTFGNNSWVPEANPFVSKFNTTKWTDFLEKQWEDRSKNAIDINEKYGIYCPKEPNVPMCHDLNGDLQCLITQSCNTQNYKQLEKGPTVKCIDTGDKKERCGRGDPWMNKTIWPMIRGPFCAVQDAERRKQFPMPAELTPYSELGYDRADPTNSNDAAPFDGGSFKDTDLLPFHPASVKEHFLKFEAMLEHYYEGLARSLLERQLTPMPDDPLYAPMLKAYADQIARALLRAKKEGADEGDATIVIGVLGDSVTSGTDNCYYDAWPEVLRRQLAPLFAAMGVKIQVRNAAKNGGWNMASQLLCVNDMLGASDRPNVGLDFLFVTNPFVKAASVDAEHLVRRALLGKSHTIVSITEQESKNDKMLTEAMLTKYAAAGLTIATPWQEAPPELGIPETGYKYWFPNQAKAFWGMQGNGFCHLTTRAGSSAVVNRNWHWGPMMHQTYADAYALLFSRATRLAIDELLSGQTPPEPRKPGDVGSVRMKQELNETEMEANPPTWKDLLLSDMGLEEAVSGGISGVRCAIGSANQPGSTLLPHWLHPAEGSPFEEKMKARNGVSFVPLDHDAVGGNFYKAQSPISPPNNAVDVGNWVADPKEFSAEAPRTAEQCRHVDGSTMLNVPKPDGVSWLVWKVPEGTVSIGRVMICHPRGAKNLLAEDAFEGDVRFHYALSDGKGGWKVIEDAHKQHPMKFVKEECTPVIVKMNEADLKAASKGGIWVAVEWKQEAIFDFDYLVAM